MYQTPFFSKQFIQKPYLRFCIAPNREIYLLNGEMKYLKRERTVLCRTGWGIVWIFLQNQHLG